MSTKFWDFVPTSQFMQPDGKSGYSTVRMSFMDILQYPGTKRLETRLTSTLYVLDHFWV